ncbi:MAG: CDP-alcohol phosphatidyltransferase family protein [Chlamydiae bacterium]|nr:CDP-alcohol phosphatidyltransferase family protein [Chlamydiota bacterium]
MIDISKRSYSGAILKFALFLTLARVALLPVFLVVYLFYPQMGLSLVAMPYVLLGILLLCELSDIFDGVVARRSKQVTNLGKVLDPMADSIVRLSILLTFTQGIVKLPLLLVLIFVFRDAVISTLRTLCALSGTALAARWSGKVKAVLQAVAIFMILILMIPYSMGLIDLEALRNASFYVVLLTALYTLFSGIEYIYVHRSAIRIAFVSQP